MIYNVSSLFMKIMDILICRTTVSDLWASLMDNGIKDKMMCSVIFTCEEHIAQVCFYSLKSIKGSLGEVATISSCVRNNQSDNSITRFNQLSWKLINIIKKVVQWHNWEQDKTWYTIIFNFWLVNVVERKVLIFHAQCIPILGRGTLSSFYLELSFMFNEDLFSS